MSQAIDLLASAGFDVSGLSQVDIRLDDLPGSLLGLADEQTIWIDRDAAGYGWYADVSATSNAAFAWAISDNEFLADAGSPAYGVVDLLTVVTHELGHLLGYASIDARTLDHNWMTTTLTTGVRRYPSKPLGSETPIPTNAGIMSLFSKPVSVATAARASGEFENRPSLVPATVHNGSGLLSTRVSQAHKANAMQSQLWTRRLRESAGILSRSGSHRVPSTGPVDNGVKIRRRVFGTSASIHYLDLSLGSPELLGDLQRQTSLMAKGIRRQPADRISKS